MGICAPMLIAAGSTRARMTSADGEQAVTHTECSPATCCSVGNVVGLGTRLRESQAQQATRSGLPEPEGPGELDPQTNSR